MKTSDIPTLPILAFIAEQEPNWCTWFGDGDNNVRRAMPPALPDRLVLAKMRNLIKRGLIIGCPCGCRGDYEMTDAGRAALTAHDSDASAPTQAEHD